MSRRPVKPGDPLNIDSQVWNERVLKTPVPRRPGPRKLEFPTNHDVIRVTGSFSKDKYEAVTLAQPTAEDPSPGSLDNNEFYNYPIMAATNEVRDPLWAVLQDYLYEGVAPRAVLSGMTWAKVDILDVDHQYFGPNSSNNGLESKEGSARGTIIHHPEGTVGEHYIFGNISSIGTSGHEIVSPTADIAGGGSGTAAILDGNMSDTGTTLILYNYSPTTMKEGCKVLAHYVGSIGRWYSAPYLTDIRVDTLKIQKRTTCDWVDVHVGISCSAIASTSSTP